MFCQLVLCAGKTTLARGGVEETSHVHKHRYEMGLLQLCFFDVNNEVSLSRAGAGKPALG